MPSTSSKPQRAGASGTHRSNAHAGPASTSSPTLPSPIAPPTNSYAPPPPEQQPTSPTGASKLPRFLQSPAQRDRSKSLSVDRPPSVASSSANSAPGARRNAGRFLGLGKDKEKEGRERERQRIREAERKEPSAEELLVVLDDDDENESPEYHSTANVPPPPPTAYSTARLRTRSDRAFSASTPAPSSSSSHSSHSHSSHAPPNAGASETLHVTRSPSRMGLDAAPLASRLGGWFAHLAGSSTSDLSLTSTIGAAAALATSTSRAARSASSSSSKAARKSDTGGGAGGSKTGLLDKAVRYLLDGDAAPDRSSAEIWLMGVRLPGWATEDEERITLASSSSSHSHSGHSHSSRSHSSHGHSSHSHPIELDPDPGPWPAAFHAAFFAQVWCTYRAGFEPIRDLPSLASLPPPLVFLGAPPGSPTHTHYMHAPPMHSPSQSDASHSSVGSRASRSSYASSASYSTSASGVSALSAASGGTGKKRWWGLGGTKGWSSDAGWGCMLRTAQSLLATALQRVGDPPLLPSSAPSFPPRTTAAHAEHARLLSWFLDSPSAPFSVHRMALAGKAAGKDVGMWFGPSAAASALRSLVNGFPACGLGVCVATDSTLFQSEVFAASHSPDALLRARLVAPSRGHGASTSSHRQAHGGKADEQAKPETRAWGDRPVLLLLGIRLGLDGVNPVYHETIKMLYTFPQSVGIAGGRPSSSYYFVGAQGDGLFYLDPHHSRPAVPPRPFVDDDGQSHESQTHDTLRRSLSPEVSSRGGSMSPEFERGGSMSPELVYARGSSLSPDVAHGHGYGQGRGHTPMTEDELVVVPRSSVARAASSERRRAPAGGYLTPAEEAHYSRAYSVADLRTYHCERVRKMPLTGLDPSMLIGFLVRDEAEWRDLRRRVGELPRTIFAIQDEPPTWPGADDDDEMELESITDPEEVADVDADDGDAHAEANKSHVASDASHPDGSRASHGVSGASPFPQMHTHSNSDSTTHSQSTMSSTSARSEVDTEDDPVAPITPLPGSSFDLSERPPLPIKAAGADADLDGDGDDFVDAGGEAEIEDDWVDPVPPPPPPMSKKPSKGKGKSKSKKPVPVPSVNYPFPVSSEDAGGAPPSPPQHERQRNVTVSPRPGGGAAAGSGQRMHTARARDGGRTQSGGVRGILTED
ncbi:hypothetical protein GGX14DRAFT_701934 [Mycena pura]|uniref:Autophagy-related protein 4 n=1 Tax=Mycena pura TaxID=153505 RepID=A0AAD6UQJ6_9AGAR|nr:hypothetical protein GGX14DRAFT_701934 [Mycena pura]